MGWWKNSLLRLSGDKGEEAGQIAGQTAALEHLIELIHRIKYMHWIFTATYATLLLLCISMLKVNGISPTDKLSFALKMTFFVIPMLFPRFVLRPMIRRELSHYDNMGIKTGDLLAPLSTITNIVTASAVLFLWKIVMESKNIEHFFNMVHKALFL